MSRAASHAARRSYCPTLAVWFLAGVALAPTEALAAKEKVEAFRVSFPKDRAYVAAFLAAQETDDFVVIDASLKAGAIKAMHPGFMNDVNTLEVKLTEAEPGATDVVISYAEPGQLVGFFTKPVANQVRRNMEKRLSETAPRYDRKNPDAPDRLIIPRPGNRPPWLTHSEEVTTTGSLDDIQEAMAQAVDKLGNDHKVTTVGTSLEDQFRLFGKDPEAGLWVFARGTTKRTPEGGLSKRIVYASHNQIATLRIIGGTEAAGERKRVRLTLDFDYTDDDLRAHAALNGTVRKYCVELRDAFLANQSQTVSLGQTQEEVEAILGKPKQVVNLGTKRLLVYENLKITLVNGKVSDVQ